MTSFWSSFVLTFVPLFIVIDAIGNLPFVVQLSEGLSRHEAVRMIRLAIITASIVGLVFLFFGRFILSVLHINVGEFGIAGGIILLVLSIRYMLTGHLVEVNQGEMVAVVPIGTPLVVGPATITTLVFLIDVQKMNLYIVLLSFALNMFISWAVFILGHQFVRFFGQGGIKAISRIFNLILAAIAISMVVRGLSLLGIINVPQ